MKYDWLLFDLDNTLMDFDEASIIAFQQTLLASNIPSQPHYYKLYKKVNHKVWQSYERKEITAIELRSRRFKLFLKEIGKTGDAKQMNATYLSQIVKHSKVLEGTRELLESLVKNYNLAIITNGLKEVQRPRLALTKIDHYFDAIIVSDEIGYAKPQKEYFDYVFNEIQMPPKVKVLVIGDSLNSDITGGNNYGIDTCWYNPSKQKNTVDIQPTFEINRLSQLKSSNII